MKKKHSLSGHSAQSFGASADSAASVAVTDGSGSYSRRTIASACWLRQTSWTLRSRRPSGSSPRAGRRNAELDKLKEQRRQLVEDEKRLRDNLNAVGHDTALYKQTLDKLGETETAIGTLSTDIGKGTAEAETAKKQLQDFISALTL